MRACMRAWTMGYRLGLGIKKGTRDPRWFLPPRTLQSVGERDEHNCDNTAQSMIKPKQALSRGGEFESTLLKLEGEFLKEVLAFELDLGAQIRFGEVERTD